MWGKAAELANAGKKGSPLYCYRVCFPSFECLARCCAFISWWNCPKNVTDSSIEGDPDFEFEAPKTLQEGCSTSLVAALDPSIEGKPCNYYTPSWKILMINRIKRWISPRLCRSSGCARLCQGEGNIDKLWALSEKLVRQKFDLWEWGVVRDGGGHVSMSSEKTPLFS